MTPTSPAASVAPPQRSMHPSGRSLAGDIRSALRHEPLVPLAILTLIAAIVRASFLDMEMRLDEATTFNEFVLQPWRATIGKYWATNNHPLHSVLAKLCVDLLGRDPWVVRIPAFVAGVLLVPATFLAVTRMFTPRAAWFAAIAVAILPVFILFSANARGYSMVALFASLQWLAMRDALQRDRRASWILVALLGALGVYTHLTMAFAYVGTVAWALVWMARNGGIAPRRLAPLVVSGAASVAMAVLLYSPFVYFSGLDALIANRNVSANSLGTLAQRLPILLMRIGQSWSMGLPAWMAVACGVLAGVAVLVSARGERAERAYPLVATLVVAAVVLASLRVPPPRAVLFLLPAILGAVGALFDKIATRLSRPQVAGVWAVAAVPLLTIGAAHLTQKPVRGRTETGWMPEARPIYEHLQRTLQPGDAIASLWLPRDILRYYYLQAGKGRAPLVPEVCPKPPHRLFLIVSPVEKLEDALEYTQLPVTLAPLAKHVDTMARYSIWVLDVPEDIPCPTRIGWRRPVD